MPTFQGASSSILASTAAWRRVMQHASKSIISLAPGQPPYDLFLRTRLLGKPESTEGGREDSGRGVRELRARWPGLHWGRWEGGGRSSVAAQGPYGRLRGLRCAGW